MGQFGNIMSTNTVMSKKQRLLVYLRQIGFELDYGKEYIICTDSQLNQIRIKRGSSIPNYSLIGDTLFNWNYDVTEYDETILKKRKRSVKTKIEINERINTLEEKLEAVMQAYNNLSQIDMQSSTGNQAQLIANQTKGEIIALKWVLSKS
jgi:hypothetical protein